jgi:hypothetical protein
MGVLDAVGNTPLIRLTRVTAGLSAAVHLNAELLNPGGSVKDRAALAMVDAAEAAGELRPGGTRAGLAWRCWSCDPRAARRPGTSRAWCRSKRSRAHRPTPPGWPC